MKTGKALLGAVLPLFCAFLFGGGAASGQEPSLDLARLWWPEQYNVWTPVSWPDHYFKFTVLYNGGVVMRPASRHWRPSSQRFAGNDFQLMFRSSAEGKAWEVPSGTGEVILRDIDGGLGIQSWDRDHSTPVLKTEFRNTDGVVLQTGMFAHAEGGGAVESSLEPVYGWIRVGVKHVDPFFHPGKYSMSVLLSKVFMDHHVFGNLAPDICIYPEEAGGLDALELQPCQGGYRLTLPDGRVRMGVFPSGGEKVSLTEERPGLYNLCLTFDSEAGRYVDLLVPMLPSEAGPFHSEASLSFGGALAEADRFWDARGRGSETVFDVPETAINEAVKSNIDFTAALAAKDFASGEYSYYSGIWEYDALWPTPASFVGLMLDYLGYGDEVAKYDAVFKNHQGTAIPPGPVYQRHPGYFSAPADLVSLPWLADHGAILWQVANHALLSGDEGFIDEWTEAIVRACDFIKEYSLMDHEGVPGLLPPGNSSDECIPLQSTWNLAWNYRGMYDAVRLLKRIAHPRAEEFEAFLKDFKETFVRSYRATVKEGPRWTDASGRQRFRPSSNMSNEHSPRTYMTDAFYLDTGPLCLVWAGLLDADDPIMADLLAFFREGPNWFLRRPVPFSCDPPVLEHEMSTCEPCYSMNAFHSWQLGDRQRYLEAMYSILGGAVSQNTFISCEHRHGMQGTQFAFPVGFMLARLAVIDDRVSEGDLHLLRLCPLGWLTSSRPARFLNMPTEFGPVSLTAQLSPDGKTLNVDFSGSWRVPPGETVLHVPPVPGLERVVVDGKEYSSSEGTILLGSSSGGAFSSGKSRLVKNMEKVMGELPGDVRGEFKVNCTNVQKNKGFQRLTINFEVASAEVVHAYLYKPDGRKKNLPAVLALHSTGPEGRRILDEEGAIADSRFARELAEEGYVVLALDYPGFGDSSGYDFASDRYGSGTIKGVYNHLSCVSLLQSLPYVDKERIGVVGHSLGGHNAIFAAAFDPRIKVVVSSCGWTPLSWYDAGEAVTATYGGRLGPWAQERYMPRIKTDYCLDPALLPFDFEDIIESLAPRPFFSSSPLFDDNFSVEGVKAAKERISSVYDSLGASENFVVVHPPCGHDLPPEVRKQILSFLRTHL